MSDTIVRYDDLVFENMTLLNGAQNDAEALLRLASECTRLQRENNRLRGDAAFDHCISSLRATHVQLQRAQLRRARRLVHVQWFIAMLAAWNATLEGSRLAWLLFFVACFTAAAGGFLFSKTLTSPHAPVHK